MKLYAYIDPNRFNTYLTEHQCVETDESRKAYLRDVGTTKILFDCVRVGFVEVSPGSCIRLHSVNTAKPAVATASETISPCWSRKLLCRW